MKKWREAKHIRPFWLTASPLLAALLLAILFGGLRLGGVVAAGNTLYVDAGAGSDSPTCGTTTTTPCQTLTYILNNVATAGDTILIAEGIYTETLTFSQPITLMGGYEAAGWTRDIALHGTVVDGSNAGGGPAILQFNAGSDGSVVDGLIIRNGLGGGGVNIDNTAVSILNSNIHNNRYDHNWGGGVFVNNNGSVTINNSQIHDNSSDGAGGLGVMNNAAAVVLNSTIDNNSASGGAGGGIGVWWGGAVTLTNSHVRWNNTPSSGGGIHLADATESIHMTNSFVIGNQAQGGGAGLDNWGTAVLMNVTLADNTCATQNDCTAGIGNYGGNPQLTVTNSILAFNDSRDLDCPNGICTVTYSDITSGWAGAGNINGNPWFADPPNADYHLLAWSPAIDSGTAASAPADDFEGDGRPQNNGIDMGADEFTGTPINNAGNRYVATTGSDGSPNLCLDPNTPCQTVSHAINMANNGESILIAQGIYTENLTINHPVNLMGGYEAAGWSRDLGQYETIIDGSGTPTTWGDWDGTAVAKPMVINNNGTYQLWYDGKNLKNEVAIGYATSTNGITWTKALNNPILTATLNTWETFGEEFSPFVLLENGTYKMWYERAGDGPRQLGYATSTDGINWTKDPNNPVLQAGPETYDQEGAAHGAILHEGSTYKLWYHAMGDQGPIIAYATSPDGTNWTKQGPVLLPDGSNWDDQAVWGASVLNINGTYWMWYGGAGSQYPPSIGVVTSTDGINWTRPLTTPAVFTGSPIGDPVVITETGTLKMWFNDFDQGNIQYAESTDGLNWTVQPNPVLTQGTTGQWSGPVVRLEPGGGGTVLDGLTLTGGSDGFGGGVHANDQDITIRSTLITGNYVSGGPWSQGGAGVLGGLGGGHVIIENSRIVNNVVEQGAGGVRMHQGRLSITNTLIANNQGDAGIHVNGPLSIMHVTVANNDGGIVFNPQAGVEMFAVNSIVYDTGGLWTDQGVIHASYSDIEGGVWPGTGNIDQPPEFADPMNGDYRLLGTSSVIDAGTPAGSPPTDLGGTPRDAAPDMGAYEFQRFAHDMNVAAVLPSGEIAVDTAVSIRATLYNVGQQPENNVPVTCTVFDGNGQVYQQTVNSGTMAPLTWDVLTFPAFTPAAPGSYTISCASNLPNDGNSANDTYNQNVTAVNEIADVWGKDNPNDDGTIPSSLNNWYESPDMWVRNNPDGGLIHQDPIAGVTNTVYVRLRNRGTVAITGTVDVYWIEPSLGVRCGDWAYIDTIAFSDLLPGETRIVSTSWVPTRSGHTCLQNVIDSTQDPYNRQLACAPQWIPWDNNVQWHNVNILENPSGGRLASTADIKNANVQLVNVYNLPQDVDLIIDRRTFPTTGTITVQLPAAMFDAWQTSADSFGDGIQVNSSTKEITVTGTVSGTIGGIPMEAAEAVQVGLVFEGPVGLAFETAVEERIDGITIGGVTYHWAIPDTTPPTVTNVTPGDTAVNIDPDAPLVITFDEPVSPVNFNLTVTPDPGGWVYNWNDDFTSVTISHNTFTEETSHTISVTTTDASINQMTTPYSWSFTTGKAGFTLFLPVILR